MRLNSLLLTLCLLFVTSTTGAAQETHPSPGLTLMPGDLVRVAVWREVGLSGEFQVNQEGIVILPLLGEWEVGGRDWTVTKEEILKAYRKELRNPSIELTPLRRVFVLGEVTLPGLYPVDPTVSLAGAVASAGGANPQGDLKRIKVIRDGRVILDGISGEEALSTLDVRSGDEIYVGRRGWFERNSTFLVTAAMSLTTIIVTLVVR